MYNFEGRLLLRPRSKSLLWDRSRARRARLSFIEGRLENPPSGGGEEEWVLKEVA
jgi:hypothetical protein